MKLFLSLFGLIVLALIVPFFIHPASQGPQGDPNNDLPWQIELDGHGGSTVFGLRPGTGTLADVTRKLGDDRELAIVAAPDEIGSLEAYYEQVKLGFLQARMVVTVDASPETITAMRERALRAQHMESMTRKITLNPDDLAAAERMPIKAIAVIPAVNLDEAAVVGRFGQPAERLAVSDKRVHLLYPDKGLDVLVDQDGKELLQYVAPRDFPSLSAPLHARKTAKTGSQ